MRVEIFKEWFRKEFCPEVTKALQEKGLPPKAILMLDNCKAHPVSLKVKDIDTPKLRACRTVAEFCDVVEIFCPALNIGSRD